MTTVRLGVSGPPVPDDPDVAIPQRAPPHEPPIPLGEPVEPDTAADSPLKA